MIKRICCSLLAGFLLSALSAADGTITLKSVRSIKINVEEPSNRIGAPSFEEIYQSRNQLVPAERLLRDFLPKILPGDPTDETVTIKVGTNALGGQYKLPELEPEEFMIGFPDEKTIIIVGGEQIGTRNGVSEFLQRFCGMRWLFPGEAGLHLPRHAELKIPMKLVRGKPFFRNRTLSWPYPFEKRGDWNYSGWYSLNRGRWDINFSHNLYRLFPWKVYGKTHPEFYPENLGPNPANDHWNPVFNAPGLTDEAVRLICEQFRRSPEQRSFSLGMNDTSRFDGGTSKGINSVGMADYSDYYYGWVNEVIAGVTKQYPDKYFGMLAYESVTDPPSFRLEPRAVPFICIDRMRWFDPAMAEKDMKRTKLWKEKTVRLGWYDYIYGDQKYMIPRIYLQPMVEYLKFAARNGVTDFYAEANSTVFPTEGPKTWLYMQLLWNPEADAEALLNEWYTLAVGRDAAPHLRRYFDFWEGYWRERVTKSEWFDRYKDWVYFDCLNDHDYMNDLTREDVVYCQNEIDQVTAKAKTPEQKRRAELFRQAWEQVKANIIYTINFHHPLKGREVLVSSNDFNTSDCLKKNDYAVQGSWMFWQNPLGNSEGVWEEKGGEDGSGALAVYLKSGARWCFTSAYRTLPNKIYRFRCRIQAENTGSDGKIYVAVYWRNKNNVQVSKYYLTRILGPEMRDGKWHTVEIQFSEPPIEKPYLNLHIGGKGVSEGVVRIDNEELAEIIPSEGAVKAE